jgi:hypothetical protein
VVKRLGAIVGAVALVVVALVVRGRLAGSDGGSGSGRRASGGDPVVACTPELADVCTALAEAGAIAADPPTLDLADATSPPAAVEAWITWDPAPAIANFDAPAPVWAQAEPLGSAPLGLLVGPDDLAGACRTTPSWACAIDAGSAGAGLGLGLTDTGEGLARILPVATALSDDRDPETIPGARLRNLVGSPVGGPGTATDLVARRLQQGPAAVGPIVAPLPLAQEAAGTPRGQAASLRAVVPTGAGGDATVVVAARTGSGVDAGPLARRCRDDRVAQALRAVGVEACSGRLAGDDIAGFLYQVREKVG